MLPDRIGRYEIKAELGRGGMATVYRGFDPRFKRDVAIKVLPREFLHDPSFQARFQREAETIAALEHAAIVPVYDFGEDEGQLFLVMRFMPGGSLADRLEQGPLEPAEAARILGRIAPALDRAHSRGIIHRDLKPDNILFDADDEPYITDFGLTKIVAQGEASFTATGSVVGTPAYMSPEQARGDKDIDGRSDIYALGATLFQMLSGKQPYEADTPMSLLVRHITDPVPAILESNPNLPPACETLIQRAMAKDRQERFATASEMVEMLAAIAQGRAVPRPPTDDTEPATKPSLGRSLWASLLVKKKAAWAIVALVVVFAVVALGLAFWPSGATPTVPTPSPETSAPESTQPPAATPPQPGETVGEAPGEEIDPRLTITAGRERIRAVAFSPDGTKLASGGEDKIVRIWDTTSGQELLSLEGHSNIVTSLTWSPDGTKLASGSDDQTIRIWDTATAALARPPLQGHTHFVLAVAWSPDGAHLASAGWDDQAIVWDVASGTVVSSIPMGGDVDSVAWSPDGTQLAVCVLWEVRVVDSSSGETLQQFPGEWRSAAWSPDGQTLAATGLDNQFYLWPLDHSEEERSLSGHRETVTSFVFSPDGRRLASTGYDIAVRVWDLVAGAELSPALAIPEPASTPFTVAWSSDGRQLAAAGDDGSIWIWDAGVFQGPW